MSCDRYLCYGKYIRKFSVAFHKFAMSRLKLVNIHVTLEKIQRRYLIHGRISHKDTMSPIDPLPVHCGISTRNKFNRTYFGFRMHLGQWTHFSYFASVMFKMRQGKSDVCTRFTLYLLFGSFNALVLKILCSDSVLERN